MNSKTREKKKKTKLKEREKTIIYGEKILWKKELKEAFQCHPVMTSSLMWHETGKKYEKNTVFTLCW